MAPLLEEALHETDPVALEAHDLIREDAHVGVGAVGELDLAHGDGLLVVADHVVEEPDDGRVLPGWEAATDAPPDGTGEEAQGDDERDELATGRACERHGRRPMRGTNRPIRCA